LAASIIVIACLTLTQAMPSALAQTSGSNENAAPASEALVAKAPVPAVPAPPRAAAPRQEKSKKKWFIVAAVAAAAGVLAVVLARRGTDPTITVGPPTVGP
jgi:hypothetical protein